MKSLEQQMAFYAAYHQDVRNKATHFVGVPVIMLSLFIPLAWPRVALAGVPLTAAMVLAFVVLAYYWALDAPLGLAMTAITAALVWLGHQLAALGPGPGWAWFAVLFVGGWILQLVGHRFEGRRPALADNLFQILIAPIFLCAEIFFALGYKPGLQRAVQERAQRMRSGA
jgi:uncharacterized membrane protein YGL010W